MHPLSASQLLEICERGSGRSPVERALVILDVAFPHASNTALERLAIGQRDAWLLRLRELTFGSEFKGLANCPACHEALELVFGTRDLPSSSDPPADPETLEAFCSERSFGMDAYQVTFRLPNSQDLKACSLLADTSLHHRHLLEACVLEVHREDEAVAQASLPPAVQEALVEHMSEADPLANLTVAATCPACGHSWQIIFDIVSYFWGEISAWSRRLMREVHSLAMAYGWREADILAMSAWRRQRYLELIGL